MVARVVAIVLGVHSFFASLVLVFDLRILDWFRVLVARLTFALAPDFVAALYLGPPSPFGSSFFASLPPPARALALLLLVFEPPLPSVFSLIQPWLLFLLSSVAFFPCLVPKFLPIFGTLVCYFAFPFRESLFRGHWTNFCCSDESTL